MSHSFAAGQGSATLRISLVVGAGLTRREGQRTDRRVYDRLVWRGMDSAAGY